MDNSLSIEFAGIKMKTPVMTGSGTFGYGPEYSDYIDLNKIGALVIKGTTLYPKAGNEGCRIAETPAGMLNSIGLENPGVDEVIEKVLPKISKYDVPIIVNIAGASVEEFGILADKLNVPEVAALEVNISCPNVKNEGMAFGLDCSVAADVVRAVKKHSNLPIITKLTPNVTDIVEIAKAVEDAGSDALSLINTVHGMAIDIRTRKPLLGNVMGGLSGPAVKPIAIRMVYQVANAVDIPIVGMGGIMTGEDAIEFMLAGADAVSVGTANFINPRATETVADEMRAYLKENNIEHINDIVGQVIV
jgi:dihydroorotate dehydrogenase (NAD+) catalytic subunit